MSLKEKVKMKLVKELTLFNTNFDQYKIDYMDKDDRSTQDDVARELLVEVSDVFCMNPKPKPKSPKKNECSICLEDISCKNDNCKLGCGHEFHLSCILKLNQSSDSYGKKCPLCRKEFTDQNNHREITRQDIHDASLRLGGLDMSLIHRVSHLNADQLVTLNSLMDVLD